MKAMVYTAPLTLELLDVPEPAPADSEVVVEVKAAGICGSELEGFMSQSPFRRPPLVMGHEFAGVRSDTGTPTVVNPLLFCRRCDLCLRGATNLCRRRSIVGIHRPGAFAERVAVPDFACFDLPDGVDFVTAALAEPLANAVHAVGLAQAVDPAPRRVAVIGGGSIGIAVTLVCLRRGFREVVVAELSPARQAVLCELGAHAASEALDGEFDVVLDAVGTPDTRRAAMAHLRPGGTAVWIGLHSSEAGFEALDFIRQEQRVLATFCYRHVDFVAAVDMLVDIVPHWVAARPLDAGVEAFLALANGETSIPKVALIPS